MIQNITPQDLIGTKAPDFSMPANAGKTIKLSNFLGKKVVLYFYPKDMTPGCTTQAKDFTCLYGEFKELDVAVIGVSKDSPERHDKFIAKYNMPYDLISDDADASVCSAFGIWQLKKFMGIEYMGIVRSTIIIDEKGIIEKVYSPVKTKNHAQKVLDDLKEGRIFNLPSF